MRFIAPFKLATRMIGGMIGTLFAGMPGLLFAGAAVAGPFGFDMADSRKPSEAYRFCGESSGGFFNFECTTAPKPHPDMEYYLMSFVEGVGVCGLKAIGRDIPDNNRGSNTRFETERLANQVKLKYGSWSEKSNFLVSNSIWDEPEDWMMSIMQEDRYYSYTWDLSRAINGINSIYLAAMAINRNTGYVIAEFYTSLEDTCDQVIKEAGAEVF